MKRFFIVLLLAVCWNFTANAQENKRERKAREQFEMAQLINSGHFRFVPRSAQSDLGTFNNLQPNYDLVFDSLHVKANLPYYGRAYNVPYGGSGGVHFDLTAKKMGKTWNEKKKMYTITAELSDVNDTYLLVLTTGLDGFADLKINFTNRSWIDYFGVIEKSEKP